MKIKIRWTYFNGQKNARPKLPCFRYLCADFQFNKYKMAGQLKEVLNRIKSVQSTQQITKAMKMVSAAKLRRAQEAIIQMRPYAKKMQEMMSNIVSNSDGGEGMSL